MSTSVICHHCGRYYEESIDHQCNPMDLKDRLKALEAALAQANRDFDTMDEVCDGHIAAAEEDSLRSQKAEEELDARISPDDIYAVFKCPHCLGKGETEFFTIGEDEPENKMCECCLGCGNTSLAEMSERIYTLDCERRARIQAESERDAALASLQATAQGYVRMEEALRAYEKWEAEVITDDRCWPIGSSSESIIRIYGPQYDGIMECQKLRNKALEANQ